MATDHPTTAHLAGAHHTATPQATSRITRTASAPAARSDNSRAAALAILRSHGLMPLPGPAWDAAAPLNVIIATGVGSTDGGEQAFFFANGKLIGSDTAETSTGLTANRLSNDLFAIRYSLYNTGDPRCCPTGGTNSVRFY